MNLFKKKDTRKEINIGIDKAALTAANASLIFVLLLKLCSSLIIGRKWELIAITAALLSISLVYMFIIIRSNAVNILSYLFVIWVNFILIPTFFVLEKSESFGVELFFGIGIISTFYIIYDRFLYFFVAIEVCYFIFLALHSLYRTDFKVLDSVNSVNNYYFIETFVYTGLLIIIALSFQKWLLLKEKIRIKQAIDIKEFVYKTKIRFLSNMNSEIRTPINSIMGINELIIRENLDPVCKEIDDHIVDSSKQLLKTVNTILEFSKLESEDLILYNQKFDFSDMMEGIIDTVANELSDKDVIFTAAIDPNIPRYLIGDYARIRQVFMYLLFSSANGYGHNRLTLKISSEKNGEDDSVTVLCRIAESGKGFSKEEINTILSAYASYDSRLDSDYKRIGLELSICRKILESMDGSLELESVEGIGVAISFSFRIYADSNEKVVVVNPVNSIKALIYSDSRDKKDVWTEAINDLNVSYRFVKGPNAFKNTIEETDFTHVFIPNEFYDILKDTIEKFGISSKTYVVADRSHIYTEFGMCKIIQYPVTCINVSKALNGIWEEDKYKLVSKSDSIIYPKARILVVDDSIVNLKVIKGVFKKFEIVPDLAQNAEEALEYINKTFYNLIVIDQLMPGVNGVELLNIIRNLTNTNSKVPVICATADFGPEIGRRLLAEGFQDYLAKPVQHFHLARILRNYLPDNLAENNIVIKENAVSKDSDFQNNNSLVVDFESGISLIGGNKEAYYSILSTYYKEGISKIKSIIEESLNDDLSLFVIDVHALKSSSASIGAKGISEQFKKLELAGRENNKDFIRNDTQETLENFEAVLSLVKKYLEDSGKFEDRNEQDSTEESEYEEMPYEYSVELQDAMNKINIKRCEEIINDLSARNFGTQKNNLVKEIKNSFEMFDYRKVKEKISELVHLIENEVEDNK